MIAYAVLYDVTTQLAKRGGRFYERFDVGAFRESVADINAGKADLACHLNHHGRILGRVSNGTLIITENDIGVRIELPDLPIPAGFTGCSFRFDLPPAFRLDGHVHVVTRARLTECCLTIDPKRPVYRDTFHTARN